jgi:hypothetical protein
MSQSSCEEIAEIQEDLNNEYFSITLLGRGLEERQEATTLGYSYAIYYEKTLRRSW